MNLRTIVTYVANFISMPEIVNTNLVDGDMDPTPDQREAYDLIINSVNMVSETIATEYFQLIDYINYDSEGEVPYTIFSSNKPLHNIIKIKKNGQNVPFTCTPSTIKTVTGKIKITYSFLPKIITEYLSSVNDFPVCVTERIFAFGVTGEYFFIKNLYDDASVWDNRFKTSLQNVLRPKKNLVVKKREWI